MFPGTLKFGLPSVITELSVKDIALRGGTVGVAAALGGGVADEVEEEEEEEGMTLIVFVLPFWGGEDWAGEDWAGEDC